MFSGQLCKSENIQIWWQFRENCSIKKLHLNTFLHSNKSWIFPILLNQKDKAIFFENWLKFLVGSDIPGRTSSIHFHRMIPQRNNIFILNSACNFIHLTSAKFHTLISYEVYFIQFPLQYSYDFPSFTIQPYHVAVLSRKSQLYASEKCILRKIIFVCLNRRC